MTDSSEPLRILSLDGGGIRGISSLLILERIMEKIRDAKGLDHVPRPCDHFDLIGGTSTGGIIAIMLGRLGMTVDECIRAYKKVAQQAFTPKPTSALSASILRVSPKGAFSETALEDAMKQIVREYCVECQHQGHSTINTCSHSDMAFRDPTCTKTVVLAITKDNVDALPTLLKTYDRSAAYDTSTLWQVARATSAATTFFKSIKLGRDEIEFIDAGFGYNNPCDILVQEAQQEFPERGTMRILSIGTGLGDVVTIKDTLRSIITALKKMATSSKKVAASMDSHYGDSGEYYRFNVDQGLQDITLSDWKTASKISAYTWNYLAENERVINKFIDDFIHHPQVSRVGRDDKMIRGRTHPNGPCYSILFQPNHRFVGREQKLKHLTDKLKQKDIIQKNNRRLAIFGLGGVGKTQVALQLAYWAKENMPAYSIFWVPALSNASFEQACTQIATKLGICKISNDENAMESVQRHLSLESTGPWILIVDNADDENLFFGSPDHPGGISKYFPECESGLTLLTTRYRGVAVSFAGKDVIELQEMDLQEATALFKESLIDGKVSQNYQDTKQLLEQLNYLPLAITQAGAYINTTDISVSKYLGLLRSTKDNAISLISRHLHDGTRYRESHNAVATTWLISFQQIKETDEAAAKLLSFISCIEPKAIVKSLLPDVGSEEQTVYAIGTLCGYSFLVKRDDTLFDMHSLVHLVTQKWVQQEGSMKETIDTAVEHISTVFPSDYYTNRELWQAYLPHSLRALQGRHGQGIEEKSALYIKVGRCLMADGRIKEAVNCFEDNYYIWAKFQCAEDHSSRLVSQHVLSMAYLADGQIRKAVNLLEHVVEIEGKTLAEEHPDRLASQHTLASAYLADGQIIKAANLLAHVVEVEGKTLTEEHPDRLASQHVLASAYQADGQISRAVNLLEHVVAVREKTLAKEHPDRLASQHTLARAYQADGQISRAVSLLEHVVAVREKALAKEHPDRLASQYELEIAKQAYKEKQGH